MKSLTTPQGGPLPVNPLYARLRSGLLCALGFAVLVAACLAVNQVLTAAHLDNEGTKFFLYMVPGMTAILLWPDLGLDQTTGIIGSYAVYGLVAGTLFPVKASDHAIGQIAARLVLVTLLACVLSALAVFKLLVHNFGG